MLEVGLSDVETRIRVAVESCNSDGSSRRNEAAVLEGLLDVERRAKAAANSCHSAASSHPSCSSDCGQPKRRRGC